MMQAPAVVHWGKGIPPDKLAYINDREEALIKGERKFKGRRDVGGIPAYPDPGDTAAGDDDKNYGSGTSTGWGGWGGTSTSSPSTSGTSTNWGGSPTASPSTSGTSTGWGGSPTGSPSTSGTSTGWGGPDTDSGGLLGGGGIGAGSGTSGGSPSDGGGGVASGGGVGGGFGSGDAGGLGAAYPGRGDYQGAYPSAAADIMAAARTLAPNSMSTPAQKAAFDKWRSEVGQRAINGFPDPAPEKTDREISIPAPGPAAIPQIGPQPGLSAPPAAPAVASSSSAPAGPPEGLLGPRSMSYGTQTSNFDVPVQSIAANTAAMTAPKIADRIAPSPGFGQSYVTARRSPSQVSTDPRVSQTPVGSYPAAQPGPADIPAPTAQREIPFAELTPLNPGLLDAPSTVASVAPQMSNIGAKTEKTMQTAYMGGTPPGLDPFAMTEFDAPAANQDVAVTPADPRAAASMYPSRGMPDPNASAYAGTPENVPPETQVAANPSATSTPWGGYFDIPARTAGTTLPKNPLAGNLMNLRKQVLSAVNDAMPTYKEPAVGDTTVADTQPPPDGLLEGPRMGDVTPPPNDYFDTARPPATRQTFAARGDGGGVRQEALDNQKKALGGKKGGKKDDKPDDGTDTPGKGSRSRWNLPDWYWQWYRTAGQYGAPRGLLG